MPKTRYRDLVLATPNLLGFWECGESAGQAIDLKGGVGNGNYSVEGLGIERSTASILPSGEGRSMRCLGGSNGCIFLPELSLPEPFTLEIWARGVPSVAAARSLIRGTGVGPPAWYIKAQNPPAQTRLDKQGVVAVVDSLNVLQSEVVYHLMVSKGVGSRKTFVNGASSTTPIGGEQVIEGVLGGYFIGGGAANQVFLGNLQYAAIYNRALTEGEAKEHFEAGGHPIAPVIGRRSIVNPRIPVPI